MMQLAGCIIVSDQFVARIILPLFNCSAGFQVPVVVATRPRQARCRERLPKEKDSPTDDSIVIETGEKVQYAHGVANSFRYWTDAVPNCQTAARKVLT